VSETFPRLDKSVQIRSETPVDLESQLVRRDVCLGLIEAAQLRKDSPQAVLDVIAVACQGFLGARVSPGVPLDQIDAQGTDQQTRDEKFPADLGWVQGSQKGAAQERTGRQNKSSSTHLA